MRIGIVGGGITGLAITHALARAGVGSVLLESDSRPGGLIRTRHEAGRILELGPQRTRLVPSVARLVRELALESRVLLARPGARLFIWARGRLHELPRSPAELARTRLLGPAARVRAMLEPLSGGLREDESVAAYFSRKTGSAAYRHLFGPLVAATFGADPAEMPARHSLPMILAPLGVRRSLLGAARRVRTDAGAQACTFKGGLGELTDRLAARHASRVRLGVHVDRLDGSLGRFTIRGQGPDGPVRELVDRVVLTVPAPVAGRVLAGIAPAAANALGGLTYNEVRVVHLDVPSTPEGFGFQVALGEPLRTRGVTWSASVFGREGMAVAYLGGGLDREIASWSDDRVSSRAVDDFEEVHGARAHVLGVGRSALPAYDASWEALAGLALPAGVTLAANYRARLGIAGRIAEAEAVARELARSGGQPASSVR